MHKERTEEGHLLASTTLESILNFLFPEIEERKLRHKIVRSTFVDENGLTKGAWSEEEGSKLKAYVQRYGHWNWRQLPRFAGLARCGKSCRLRWMNYLKPGVRRGNYTPHEEDLILKLNKEFGNRLPGRTDNEIKNYWHTHLRRRAKQERKASATHHHHDHKYEESSFDSTSEEMNDGILETADSTNINFAAHHVYSDVSSLYHDPSPTLFQADYNSSPSFSKMPAFSSNTDLLREDEIVCPFSPYIDENYITWLHDFLQL